MPPAGKGHCPCIPLAFLGSAGLAWGLAFLVAGAVVAAHAAPAVGPIPARFQGFWYPRADPCDAESHDRYDIHAHAIDEFEIDSIVRTVHAKGQMLRVVVDEGYEGALKRRTITFKLAPNGKTMLIDGAPYIRCR